MFNMDKKQVNWYATEVDVLLRLGKIVEGEQRNKNLLML